MARIHRRRTGLLLTAVVLVAAVFGINALVAWFWPQHPGLLVALVAFDFAAFVVIFGIFHAALDPPREGSRPVPRFKRRKK